MASCGRTIRLLEIRGERAAPRITYLEGSLQITSPSKPHESIKIILGTLVETYCMEQNIEFLGTGSWTIENQGLERGAEGMRPKCSVTPRKPFALTS